MEEEKLRLLEIIRSLQSKLQTVTCQRASNFIRKAINEVIQKREPEIEPSGNPDQLDILFNRNGSILSSKKLYYGDQKPTAFPIFSTSGGKLPELDTSRTQDVPPPSGGKLPALDTSRTEDVPPPSGGKLPTLNTSRTLDVPPPDFSEEVLQLNQADTNLDPNGYNIISILKLNKDETFSGLPFGKREISIDDDQFNILNSVRCDQMRCECTFANPGVPPITLNDKLNRI